MDKPKSYRDLTVWQDSIKLAKQIYEITEKFPINENYALTNQMRRAAISVPSNIAEGQARRSPADFRRFLYISIGSLAEIDTQLVLAQEFGYLEIADTSFLDEQILSLRKRLYALINSIR